MAGYVEEAKLIGGWCSKPVELPLQKHSGLSVSSYSETRGVTVLARELAQRAGL